MGNLFSDKPMLREPGAPQKQGTSRDEGPDRASKNRKIIKLMDCGGRGDAEHPYQLGVECCGGLDTWKFASQETQTYISYIPPQTRGVTSRI